MTEQRTRTQRLRQAELSAHVAAILATGDPLERKLSDALDAILEVLGASRGSIMLANSHGDLVVEAATQRRLIGHRAAPEDGGIAHFVLETARSLSIADVRLDERFPTRPDSYQQSSMLSVPIRDGELVVGVINATDKAGGQAFTLDDERVIAEFQGHAALLIQHARMREQLSQTIRVKEQLTRMLVHDLKGPLAAIMANLDMLLYDLDSKGDVDPAEAAEMLQASRASSNTLMQMVLNLLDLARAGDDAQGDPAGASTRLSGAIGSGGRSLTRALPAQVELSSVRGFFDEQRPLLEAIGRHRLVTVRVTVHPQCPERVAFDPALLSRVLINLTMNAVEHTPQGAQVEVECDPGARRPQTSMAITVSDEGQGVPTHMRESIFDAYFSGGGKETSRAKGNHGLGLAFCKLACRAQEGRIELLPQPEGARPRGAAFRVIIPRATITAEEVAQPQVGLVER